ncbi:MAG: hypothetical protein OK449_02330 [Thaumarchaeota archaeon]|nr:hypothetical protein [Nitrososphaerota archaeon]
MSSKGKPTDGAEVDADTLDEGCYYLAALGLTPKEVAERFEIDPRDVLKRKKRFEAGLKSGEIEEDPASLVFWRSVREEAEGNVKVTFVSGKGFHHAWRSDLKKFDGPTLLAIYESCKDFMNLDPNARFLQYDAPKNYDPLAMQREIAKAVVVFGNLIEEKWKEERPKGSKKDGR